MNITQPIFDLCMNLLGFIILFIGCGIGMLKLWNYFSSDNSKTPIGAIIFIVTSVVLVTLLKVSQNFLWECVDRFFNTMPRENFLATVKGICIFIAVAGAVAGVISLIVSLISSGKEKQNGC